MMLRRRLQASKQGQNQWLSSDGNDTEPSETLNNVQGDIITLVWVQEVVWHLTLSEGIFSVLLYVVQWVGVFAVCRQVIGKTVVEHMLKQRPRPTSKN